MTFDLYFRELNQFLKLAYILHEVNFWMRFTCSQIISIGPVKHFSEKCSLTCVVEFMKTRQFFRYRFSLKCLILFDFRSQIFRIVIQEQYHFQSFCDLYQKFSDFVTLIYVISQLQINKKILILIVHT